MREPAECGVSSTTTSGCSLLERYRAVRRFSEKLCEPLTPEDCVIQSMPDVSPTRWHLAHTTWFFEAFVLARSPGYEPFHPKYEYLFNSNYNHVGEQFPRPRRGLLSRPTVSEVLDYRAHVDARMDDLCRDGAAERSELSELSELRSAVEIGLNHEQQHQELILTDIKHVLSCNPLFPVYADTPVDEERRAPPLAWARVDEGLRWIGHQGESFAFDNESPTHRVFLDSFFLCTRLVTNAEYVSFIEDGGYRRPDLWLSAGWEAVRENGWEAPLYWLRRDGAWSIFTLSGLRPVNPEEPVCHVSYFEADAFARWAGARLPTEGEWEVSGAAAPIEGNFVENGSLHPRAVTNDTPGGAPAQLFGDVWEWTSSPYTAYPGFGASGDALGEYNGKFMCNHYVLRGGSCATSITHVRRTYRNFLRPEARWQFSGMRLAR